MDFAKVLHGVRERKPLVQCITNFVTVNDCANIILAAGGSPTMAEHILEAAEAVEKADALVCNMGAIDKAESMILAGKQANLLGKPVILDPVGAGGTRLRRDAVKRLIDSVDFSVIRGNASEIRYLAGQNASGSGVDAGVLDEITEGNLSPALTMAEELARKLHTVIAISGKIDIVTDGKRTCILRGGCATMARITGSGCMLSALMGAFCGSCGDPFAGACAAAAVMGVSGELAEQRRIRNGTGNATFRNDLIDAVFNLTAQQLTQGANYEIYEK